MSLISSVVLILLVSAWAWVLGRPILQNLLNASRRDPVGHFNRQLSVLGQAPEQSMRIGSRGMAANFQAQSAKRRRLQWFLGFVMASVASLALALMFGGIFVWQHLMIDAMLVGYVVFAARSGALERERAAKVTSLRIVSNNPAPLSTPFLRAVGDR